MRVSHVVWAGIASAAWLQPPQPETLVLDGQPTLIPWRRCLGQCIPAVCTSLGHVVTAHPHGSPLLPQVHWHGCSTMGCGCHAAIGCPWCFEHHYVYRHVRRVASRPPGQPRVHHDDQSSCPVRLCTTICSSVGTITCRSVCSSWRQSWACTPAITDSCSAHRLWQCLYPACIFCTIFLRFGLPCILYLFHPTNALAPTTQTLIVASATSLGSCLPLSAPANGAGPCMLW